MSSPEAELFLKASEKGWKRLVKYRATGHRRCDIYYIVPDGNKRLRSRREVENYLHDICDPDLIADNFPFSQRLLGLGEPVESSATAVARNFVPKRKDPVEKPVRLLKKPVKLEKPIKLEKPVKLDKPVQLEKPVKLAKPPAKKELRTKSPINYMNLHCGVKEAKVLFAEDIPSRYYSGFCKEEAEDDEPMEFNENLLNCNVEVNVKDEDDEIAACEVVDEITVAEDNDEITVAEDDDEITVCNDYTKAQRNPLADSSSTSTRPSMFDIDVVDVEAEDEIRAELPILECVGGRDEETTVDITLPVYEALKAKGVIDKKFSI